MTWTLRTKTIWRSCYLPRLRREMWRKKQEKGNFHQKCRNLAKTGICGNKLSILKGHRSKILGSRKMLLCNTHFAMCEGIWVPIGFRRTNPGATLQLPHPNKTVYAARKSNMLDSHYTILYAGIRPFLIVPSCVTRCIEILLFDLRYTRALQNVHRIPE